MVPPVSGCLYDKAEDLPGVKSETTEHGYILSLVVLLLNAVFSAVFRTTLARFFWLLTSSKPS